ncbi:MAG: GspE/PulE family protein [Chlamydiales bacterium]|nr:GspE/PulE family protein [Chlamydiales bacterium]
MSSFLTFLKSKQIQPPSENNGIDHDLYSDIIKKGILNEDEASVLFADYLNLSHYQSSTTDHFPQSFRKILSYSFLKTHLVLPLRRQDNSIIILTSHFKDLDVFSYLSFLLREEYQIYFTTRSYLLDKIKQIYEKTSEPNKTTSSSFLEKDIGFDLLDNDEARPTISQLNQLIKQAIESKASDIHFEAQEGFIQVRLRIDGSLVLLQSFQKEVGFKLINRVKIMARFDLAKHLLPQDGQFKVYIGSNEYDIRASTTPTIFGERVVLRVLERNNKYLDIKNLKIPGKVYNFITNSVQKSGGIVLVTGPTGSGKTTTLYSALSTIDAQSKNIMTIEDPVEYRLPLASQISINPKVGYSFSKGLKHILRQDPDIILIGEIRDTETAKIAIQASLTGHLVLSTLHTRNAITSITRLIELGVEPYLLSSTLLGVINQRLVRKNCPNCLIRKPISESQKKYFSNSSIKYTMESTGCEICLNTSFKGRQGIFELLQVDQKVQAIISQKSTNLSNENIPQDSYIPLWQDGIRLVEDGVISLNEFLRVTME